MYAWRAPSRGECLLVLGMRPDATRVQIKRAYRRLALRYHPDRNRAPSACHRGQADCESMFRRVTRAYTYLDEWFEAEQAGAELAHCARCGDAETLLPGLDGNRYCRTCLLRAEGKRSLPGPRPVVVCCTTTAIGLAASAAWLLAWWATGWRPYWWMAVATCALAMIVMVAVCLAVQYAAPAKPYGPGRHPSAWRRWRRRLAF